MLTAMSQHAGAGLDAGGVYSGLFECLACGSRPWLPITLSGYTTVCPGCNVNGRMSCIDSRQIALECRNSGCVYFRIGIRNLPWIPRGVCAGCPRICRMG
ncbi:hypothetical protein Tco_0955919 [Tanacetum coccineum]|uniref:Uncharacterized protein n=1 Tax=Tanacetum coccineum TaxID=301880 RepID=A0ABQ5E8H8_9ASTR